MKIIPTPQTVICSERILPINGFKEIRFDIPTDQTILWGVEQLRKQYAVPEENGEILTLKYSADDFFQEKNAAEQGYILKRNADGITLLAQSSIGFLYGLMTLLQLKQAPEEFTIYDRPRIRFRGNMNTLWAESGVWSYDFGDGLEAACRRVRKAIDEAAKMKLNLMYVDAFGFRTERFPGYDAVMRNLSEYGRVRGVRMMVGGYGMSYGQSANGNDYAGTVFYNRDPYPDGELYDCIGTYDYVEGETEIIVKGRSFGTCLSNDALTDDKIEDLRRYLRATGVSVLYLHNMDADQIHEPLWLARCEKCRKRFPNDSLYAKDGAAGAFAAFYDRILTALRPEFPDLIICAISPGYAYADTASDPVFEKCRRFWAAILEHMENKDGLIPTFREHFYQHEEKKLRFDLLHEAMPTCGCVYFSSGDGFYSDKIYTPSAAYCATMKEADLIICANGGALQKPTQATNAEYLWNPDHSAFWIADIPDSYEPQMAHYHALREGVIRPDGIYGEEGLLETSCNLLFGEKYGTRVADVFRVRGKNGECPILTACNVELWTRNTTFNYPWLWDTPVNAEQQKLFRERFAECALATTSAKNILEEVLQAEDLDSDVREHLAFLHMSAAYGEKVCAQLTRYMDLYMEADRFFADGVPVSGDLLVRCDVLVRDAKAVQQCVQRDGRKAFDPLGGVLHRREELPDFIAYCASQISQSIKTNQRIPKECRPLRKRNWW